MSWEGFNRQLDRGRGGDRKKQKFLEYHNHWRHYIIS